MHFVFWKGPPKSGGIYFDHDRFHKYAHFVGENVGKICSIFPISAQKSSYINWLFIFITEKSFVGIGRLSVQKFCW